MRANRVHLLAEIRRLPDTPGVYLFRDGRGVVLYIGKADHLRQRVRSYFSDKGHVHPRTKQLVEKIASLETVVTSGRREALVLEATFIRKHRPKYNVTLKESEHYPYVCFTGGDFPRLIVTRMPESQPGPCFGPYTDVRSLRDVLKLMRAGVPLRSCSDAQFRARRRPCVLYQMKRCLAPCIFPEVSEEYRCLVDRASRILQGRVTSAMREMQERMRELAEELRFEEAAVMRDRIAGLTKLTEKQRVVLRRKVDMDVIGLSTAGCLAVVVVQQIREGRLTGQRMMPVHGVDMEADDAHILSAVLAQYYLSAHPLPGKVLMSTLPSESESLTEWLGSRSSTRIRMMVPKSGIGAAMVAGACTNAARALEEELARLHHWEKRVPEGVIRLGRLLGMRNTPRLTVGMDVSNLAGRETVGSVVCFKDGLPWKSAYRRYKLSGSSPDDPGMILEMARRWAARVVTGEIPVPDLLVVDGGETQLSAVRRALDEQGMREGVTVIGLAKREELIHRLPPQTPLRLQSHDPALQMVQRVRDEAHRFGVRYHRTVRRKKLFRSSIEEISGLGPVRAAALLARFGGIEGLRSASEDDILKLSGFGRKLAAKIKESIERS